MLSKSLQALLQRAGRVPRLFGAAVLGSLVALCVPIIAYLLGTLVECLAAAGPGAPARTRLSAWLPDMHTLLPPMAPLAEVATLLGILLFVLALAAVLLLVFYRTLQHAAVAFEVNMIRQLRSHAKRLAMTRTLSAQETALTDCLDYHLPRVRAA